MARDSERRSREQPVPFNNVNGLLPPDKRFGSEPGRDVIEQCSRRIPRFFFWQGRPAGTPGRLGEASLPYLRRILSHTSCFFEVIFWLLNGGGFLNVVPIQLVSQSRMFGLIMPCSGDRATTHRWVNSKVICQPNYSSVI